MHESVNYYRLKKQDTGLVHMQLDTRPMTNLDRIVYESKGNKVVMIVSSLCIQDMLLKFINSHG